MDNTEEEERWWWGGGGDKGEDELGGDRLCQRMVYSFHTNTKLQISIILDMVHIINLTKHHFCILKGKRCNN